MPSTNAVQQQPVILFDGVCNFCNGTVNFLLKQDKKKRFRFAALQSEAGQALLAQYGLSKENLDTFILVDNGKVYRRSTAALRVGSNLPWYWQWTQAFRIVPPFIRDGVYNFIARNRYKWFGKKKTCMLPAPGMQSRYL
ncbi:thiol-disulfide oxidoreductase DCC family protein [Flavisolibacter nicotianae]|uniref:thiol-disulfide oxidoreductase DCC family protein n=1 Tax=Flavisolibacter nicotianae TaxID=2364882 RepID=UPI000EAC8E3E|nr:thiol-disulfide oxidoreductase DCC family protein [Flavisolibacter nicotianae]